MVFNKVINCWRQDKGKNPWLLSWQEQRKQLSISLLLHSHWTDAIAICLSAHVLGKSQNSEKNPIHFKTWAQYSRTPIKMAPTGLSKHVEREEKNRNSTQRKKLYLTQTIHLAATKLQLNCYKTHLLLEASKYG